MALGDGFPDTIEGGLKMSKEELLKKARIEIDSILKELKDNEISSLKKEISTQDKIISKLQTEKEKI